MTKITKQYVRDLRKAIDKFGVELKQLTTDLHNKHKSLKAEKDEIERDSRQNQASKESLARLAQLEEELKENAELIVLVTGKSPDA